MQLPNKLYSYKNSTLALIPVVLNELKQGPMLAGELYLAVKPSLAEATDFLSVMDCLYALRAVDITDGGEVYQCLSK
ncbi:MAG: ABC-three component system middle component 7 [Anaerotruncus rubiinfantis]|jgi:hypothetical protein